ncbi:MAG: DUF805 domain-containing protein [Lentisphaeria bacterium]|nr:DUF805 domain-containing protein [Lentisphaeria bacterium]
MNYYIDAFRNYVNFQGRANRTQFWMFILFNLIAGVILFGIAFAVPALAFLITVYNLAVFLPSLAICVRRLHDTDRSGWWILLGLIPLVGGIIMLILYLLPGTPGANRFGGCGCGCCGEENAEQ